MASTSIWNGGSRDGRHTEFIFLSADQIAAAIESSHLDIEEVTIEGRVLTVSTVQSQEWLIEQGDGTHVSIKHSRLPYEQTVGIATDARLRITAQMKTAVSHAGVTRITYEAISVDRLDVERPES
jgi:hypothetical protein